MRSTPGEGSRFEIVLEGARVPASLVPKPDPILDSDQPHAGFEFRAGSLVLVAEDQPVLRHLLKEILGRMAEVVTAADGEEAYRLAVQLHPDLLLTDNQMPGMDGMEVVAALRGDPAIPYIPVVLLTGDSEPIDERISPQGEVVVVRKPFSRGELMEQVSLILARTPARPARCSSS